MKILFIGHDASLSGAPISLLRIIRFLKENIPDLQCEVLLGRGGVLVTEYNNLCKTKVMQSYTYPFPWHIRIINRVKKHFLNKLIKLQFQNYTNGFDLIFVNSVASLKYLDETGFNPRGKAMIRIAELPYSINEKISKEKFLYFLSKFEKIIVPSKFAKKALANEFKIGLEKIEVIYGAIDERIKINPDFYLRSYLGIDKNAFIVGGSGASRWYKGVEVFVQVYNQLIKKNHNIYFVWLGKQNDVYSKQIIYDLQNINGRKNFFYLESVQNPIDFYNQFDIFFLSSRLDTFPLVCIENGFCGTPVICFEKSGGAPEYAELGGGDIVPYLDIVATADQIWDYYNNSELLANKRIMAKRTSNKFTSEESGKQYVKQILTLLDK